MNTPTPEQPSGRKPIVKYTMMSFYFLFIGFCAAGIYLKWNALTNQRTYAYEEGFSVSAPVPALDNGPSFLERFTRRSTRRVPPVKLPERNQRALQTWQKYAAPIVDLPSGNATVILVIDDLGIVKRTTKNMIEMDVPLTLASTEPSVQMESINYNLSQFENYIGINNHMGSKFTEDEEAVSQFLGVIKQKGLMVLDSKTTSNSVLESLADENEIPVINRDVFLDNNKNFDYIMGQLDELTKTAKKNGNALGIGHPYPETVAALKAWIPTLRDKGITIVPISQTVREKYAQTLLAGD